MAAESRRVLFIAIGANLAIAAVKFTAAVFTGSAAMVAEGIHSLVDTGNGGLMLLGMRLSRRPPDEDHPFGHGKEVYVWTLVVAVLVFAVGGGMSALEGLMHLIHPAPLRHVGWNYAILAIGLGFDAASWIVALRAFRRE